MKVFKRLLVVLCLILASFDICIAENKPTENIQKQDETSVLPETLKTEDINIDKKSTQKSKFNWKTFFEIKESMTTISQIESEFVKRLNLTTKQLVEITHLQTQTNEELNPVLKEIKMKRKKIEELKFYNAPDDGTKAWIKALVASIEELKAQAYEIKSREKASFIALLDETQKAEYEKMQLEVEEIRTEMLKWSKDNQMMMKL